MLQFCITKSFPLVFLEMKHSNILSADFVLLGMLPMLNPVRISNAAGAGLTVPSGGSNQIVKGLLSPFQHVSKLN